MKNKQKVICLTWASWVGKTTITNKLKEKYGKDLENFLFSSFDNEWKIPEEKEVFEKWWSWEAWQKETSEIYIEKIIKNNPDISTLILDRQANIDFIIWWFEKINFTNYKIILVTCSEEEMKKRLEKRWQPELFNPDMMNWIKFLEKQAKEKKIKILDTSNISLEESILEIEKEIF